MGCVSSRAKEDRSQTFDNIIDEALTKMKNSKANSYLWINFSALCEDSPCPFPSSKFSDRDMEKLSEALFKLPNLTHLSIDTCDVEVPEEGFRKLSESIAQLKNLEGLYLWLNSKKELSAESLFNLSNSLMQLHNLTEMKIYILVNDSGLKILSDALSKLQNLTKFVLHIYRKREFSDEASICFSKALAEMHSLKELRLFFSISDSGVKILSESIPHIYNLNDFEWQLADDDKITESGWTGLFESFAKLSNLNKLKFNNALKKIKEAELGEVLARLENLNSLDITFSDGCIIEDSGLKKLCESLAKLQKLTEMQFVFYKSTKITDDGLVSSVNCFPQRYSMFKFSIVKV